MLLHLCTRSAYKTLKELDNLVAVLKSIDNTIFGIIRFYALGGHIIYKTNIDLKYKIRIHRSGDLTKCNTRDFLDLDEITTSQIVGRMAIAYDENDQPFSCGVIGIADMYKVESILP